jgi:endonuclease/exonuclease/phosphatase family metal-dependent hydrolase
MPIEAQAKALSGSLADVTEHKTPQEFVRNVSADFCTRSTILVLMLVVGLVCQSGLRARADENENAVKIMTQNVDAGTDFGYLTGQVAFEQGVFFTYLEINASNIVPRAAQLAGEIALDHPALVGLQEVTMWRTGPLHLSPTPPSAPLALYDQLKLLLDDLANQYMKVAVQTLTDVEVPVITGKSPAGQLIGFDLRFTDLNVVLVRTDLRQQLALSNIQMHQFKDQSVLPTPVGNVSILRGWISVDMHVQGNLLRFVTTHLETDADPVTQLKQANELVQALNSQDNPPVVLCGDFNADADTPNPTIAAIRTGGFTDVWPTLHPLDPGFTVPLYIEDLPSPPPYTAVSTPSHRIDLVFVRDLRATQITLVGNQVTPPWPSDHAGVVASVPIDQ